MDLGLLGEEGGLTKIRQQGTLVARVTRGLELPVFASSGQQS